MASNKSRGLLARLRSSASRGLASVKELGVTPGGNVGWTVRSGGARSTFYAGSDVDWEERAGTLWLNSAVSLCAGFLFNKVCEPSLEVRRTSAGRAGAKEEAVPEHPLLALLARPNPEYSGNALLQAVALSYKAKGNAYVVKVRDAGGLGAPRELWYVPHWQMEPLEPSGGGPTEFYRHTVGGKSKYYPRRDVIHLKFGMDPEKPRLGFDPSRAQLAGVVSDTQVDVYTATILTGLGVIGAFVSPATSGDKISPEQAERVKEMWREQTTGDSRGGVIVPSLPVKVEKVGSTPEEMALDKIGNRPESRICAWFGFEPMAIGLPSGNTTYANKAEARQASMENGIIPFLTAWAEIVTLELLPEVGGQGRGSQSAPAGNAEAARWNYDGVRDLMPDQDKLVRRAVLLFTRGIWKLSEVRLATGAPKDEERDGYVYELLPEKVAAGDAASSDPPVPAD